MKRTGVLYRGVFISFLLVVTTSMHAQLIEGLGRRARNAAERAVERRVEREAAQKTDEAIDEVLKGKKNKKGSNQSAEKKERSSGKNEGRPVNSNSDFEAGTKTLVLEDFAKDRINDLPAQWNTDAAAKVVTLGGSNQKWMELSSPGTFVLETVKSLPEHFTLEFDLLVSPTFSYYDYPLWIGLVDLKIKKDFFIWSRAKEKRGKDKRNGALLMLHPQEEGGKKRGYSEYEIWENSEKAASNRLKSLASFTAVNNQVRVQVWRQGQRLRMYLDGEKIWDIPRAFDAGQQLNTLLFSRYESKEGNYFYISNIRVAVSGEDLRSKILKDGAYSTNAILFNTNAAVIKPESHTIIQEIASLLKDTPALKLQIVGHTDAEGKKEANLVLSKQRAAAVKNELVKKYGIAENRLSVDGKGDAEPVADNTTASGKAQNRRVVFIKQ